MKKSKNKSNSRIQSDGVPTEVETLKSIFDKVLTFVDDIDFDVITDPEEILNEYLSLVEACPKLFPDGKFYLADQWPVFPFAVFGRTRENSLLAMGVFIDQMLMDPHLRSKSNNNNPVEFEGIIRQFWDNRLELPLPIMPAEEEYCMPECLFTFNTDGIIDAGQRAKFFTMRREYTEEIDKIRVQYKLEVQEYLKSQTCVAGQQHGQIENADVDQPTATDHSDQKDGVHDKGYWVLYPLYDHNDTDLKCKIRALIDEEKYEDKDEETASSQATQIRKAMRSRAESGLIKTEGNNIPVYVDSVHKPKFKSDDTNGIIFRIESDGKFIRLISPKHYKMRSKEIKP